MKTRVLTGAAAFLFSWTAIAAPFDEAKEEAAYYASIGDAANELAKILGILESNPKYRRTISTLTMRAATCRDWIVIRRINFQPFSRSATLLCRAKADSKVWSVELWDVDTGRRRMGIANVDLSGLISSLRVPSMIGDSGHVWTDGSYAFVTMQSDDVYYRHAVICPGCASQVDSPASYNVLTSVINEVSQLVKKSTMEQKNGDD